MHLQAAIVWVTIERRRRNLITPQNVNYLLSKYHHSTPRFAVSPHLSGLFDLFDNKIAVQTYFIFSVDGERTLSFLRRPT